MKGLKNFGVVEIDKLEIKTITGGGFFDGLGDSIMTYGIAGPVIWSFNKGYEMGSN